MALASLAAMLLTVPLAAPPSDLVLKGLVHSPDASVSVAVLSSGGRTRVVAPGESVFGGRLTTVTADSVTLTFDGQHVLLRLAAAAVLGPPPSPSPTPVEAASQAAPPETSARRIPRVEVDRRVALEMDRILAETALTPVTEGGRVSGVAIKRMASGTVLSEVGLRVGDVITEINGTRIDGLATLMGLYSRLQGERLVSATVLRDGRPVLLKLTFE
jgi:type II secretion system protein C